MRFTELAGHVALVVAAVAYWAPSLRVLPNFVLFSLYFVGCVTFIAHGVLSGIRNVKDTQLACQGKVFVGASGVVLGILASAPLLYWGWQAAVFSVYADT